MIRKIKNKESQINISIYPGYATDTITIEKGYFKDNKLEKIIYFSIWDDICFNAWINNLESIDDLTELEFEITIEDQIYFALNRLLGIEDEFYIDDDHTLEHLKNYMLIKRGDNKIIILFHDEKKEKLESERFNVFIKNIFPDGRSKIDDFNIKYRIGKFFEEAKEILLNDNHQYSFDEWYEIFKHKGIYHDKNPFILKNERKFKNFSESCLNCIADCNIEEKSFDNWCNKYEPSKILRKIK